MLSMLIGAEKIESPDKHGIGHHDNTVASAENMILHIIH